ncbi:MAG: EexN family lipoprotein, partial [Phenylobacterium sp.]
LIVIVGALSACGAQPRSSEYFQSHPAEAARIIADCRKGQQGGRECETAAAGQAAREADKRLKLFRRSFR